MIITFNIPNAVFPSERSVDPGTNHFDKNDKCSSRTVSYTLDICMWIEPWKVHRESKYFTEPLYKWYYNVVSYLQIQL